MATPVSQNGYLANRPDLQEIITVPGSKVRFRVRKGDVAYLFQYLARRFDDEVEDLDTAGGFPEDPAPNIPGGGPSEVFDDWSYAEREVRGSTTTLSNHASGTAVDFNATQHPLGKRGTFTDLQVARIRNILADMDNVIRWGGDYTSRADEMHFEINASPEALKRVADRLREAEKPKPAPAPAPTIEVPDMLYFKHGNGIYSWDGEASHVVNMAAWKAIARAHLAATGKDITLTVLTDDEARGLGILKSDVA